jgi:hypothetical protein
LLTSPYEIVRIRAELSRHKVNLVRARMGYEDKVEQLKPLISKQVGPDLAQA